MTAEIVAARLLHAEGLRPRSALIQGALDIQCQRGTVTVLTGPSAEETGVWLETLALLHPQLEGSLHVLPSARENSEALRRKIGYVAANAPLLSTFDVRMNVMLPRLYHCKDSQADARRRADNLLDRFGYTGPRNETPAQLGVLEQMQALLARALALDPPLVFIDEPFDIDTVADWQQLAESIHSLASDDNRAVLIATRNLAFAAAHADQLVFIQDGRATVHANWNTFAAASAPARFIRELPFLVEASP